MLGQLKQEHHGREMEGACACVCMCVHVCVCVVGGRRRWEWVQNTVRKKKIQMCPIDMTVGYSDSGPAAGKGEGGGERERARGVCVCVFRVGGPSSLLAQARN